MWAESQSSGVVAVAVGLFGLAVDEEILDRNPFRGLVRKGRGRADDNPPTPDEFDRLLDSGDALGDYADQMRALMVVGAYTGMRPGELFALEWGDIDLAAHRIHVGEEAGVQGRTRPAEVEPGTHDRAAATG